MRFCLSTVPTLGLLAGAFLCCTATAAPPDDANQHAYTLTLMCVSVAGHEGNQADKLRAMDALRKMQRAMGYSNRHLADDMVDMAQVLGVKMRNDPGLMPRNREICRKLGLIG